MTGTATPGTTTSRFRVATLQHPTIFLAPVEHRQHPTSTPPVPAKLLTIPFRC